MKKGSTLKEEIKRVQGIPPKQYIRGWSEFYKLKFYLTPDVLIPRSETELIVDEVMNIANIRQFTINSLVDVGTGSGCIAISIAKNLQDVKVIAIDISQKALEVANKNARFHKADNRIVFIQNDLLENFAVKPDIIVANLPYIPTARLMLIDPMVADFEPKIALDGGRDGFDLYRRLFQQIKEKNLYPKYLIIEFDDTQSEIAPQEARNYFPNAKVEVKKDLAKIDRFLIIHFPSGLESII